MEKVRPFTAHCLEALLLLGLAFSRGLAAQSGAGSSTAVELAWTNSWPEAPSVTAGREWSPGFEAASQQGAVSGSTADSPLTLKGFPKRFLHDEVHIFNSPARIRSHDLKWLLPLAGVTAVALATDTKTMRDVVSHDPSFNDANNTTSDVLRGAFIGVPVVLYGAGTLIHNQRAHDAGLLAGEAMVDAYVFDEVEKHIFLRERPSENNARGHFFVGSAAGDPSFVSGHVIVAWSSAAALAGKYAKPWQQAGLYTLATGVSLTRVLGQQHFPTDVLLGSVSGWLIGHYVYRAHHRHNPK